MCILDSRLRGNDVLSQDLNISKNSSSPDILLLSSLLEVLHEVVGAEYLQPCSNGNTYLFLAVNRVENIQPLQQSHANRNKNSTLLEYQTSHVREIRNPV